MGYRTAAQRFLAPRSDEERTQARDVLKLAGVPEIVLDTILADPSDEDDLTEALENMDLSTLIAWAADIKDSQGDGDCELCESPLEGLFARSFGICSECAQAHPDCVSEEAYDLLHSIAYGRGNGMTATSLIKEYGWTIGDEFIPFTEDELHELVHFGFLKDLGVDKDGSWNVWGKAHAEDHWYQVTGKGHEYLTAEADTGQAERNAGDLAYRADLMGFYD